ncbi:MAG: hypothetical protein ACR2PT_02720 [Endozoicomonas sp.]
MSLASSQMASDSERLTVRLLSSGSKIEDPSSGVSIRLDDQGRWCTFRRQGGFFRRCLDGLVVKGAGEDVVPEHDKAFLIAEIQRQVRDWGNLVTDPRLSSLLAQAEKYDDEYYKRLARLYADVYPEAVPILPPDRYGDLVIQPARGCPNRACTFCAFYQDKPFRVLSEQELDNHLSGILELFGLGLAGKDGVFLGSANAMALSQRRLMHSIGQIKSRFGRFNRGIAAFADPDYSAKRTESDWQDLFTGGLRQLVIGLETGWGDLRQKLGKAGDLTAVRQAVTDYKEAGISVGLTVLTGACPAGDVVENVERTTGFIARLGLEPSDLVYLSPLSGKSSCEALREKERRLLKKHLTEYSDAKTVSYQMQRFRYYA